MFSRYVSLITLFACTLTHTASAVILYGEDNSANQTDPGTGVPWASVGKVSSSATGNPQGSAVYLGNRYVLTAHHVPASTGVTFDGSTFFTYDAGFSAQQIAPNVDAKILRLASDPGVAPVNLLDTPIETVSSATLIGWGIGRDPSEPVNTSVVSWGALSTSAKRWGTNTLAGVTNLSYQSGSYSALATTLETLTSTEAATADKDSGSGLFQNIGGTWYLIGMTTAVSFVNGSATSTFALAGSDANYFLRISSYENQIQGIIPELGHYALTSALFLTAILPLIRRRSR